MSCSFTSTIMFKVSVLLACITLVAAVPLALILKPLNPELNEHWENFKVRFGKSYSSPEFEISRRMIFEQNVKKIQQHNLEYDLGQHSFFLGINKFADNTFEEFLQILKPFNLKDKKGSTFLEPSIVGDLPSSVDWRTKGCVTPVKNSLGCGSTYFSITGVLEGQACIKNGKLISLSEQNLIDCSRNEGNLGCEQAFINASLAYCADKGIDTEASYPYEGVDGTCRYNPATVGVVCNGGHVDIPSGDENSLKSAIATVGPISVLIDASQNSFQLYAGGVYNEPACNSFQLDHAVLAVGYGTTSEGTDFWIVKNEWGTDWGMDGYIEMSRNKKNQCGIATSAFYPLL